MSFPAGLPTIASVTPTLCALFGIEPPALCTAPVLQDVLAAARVALEGRPLRRALVFAPDAVGNHLRAARPGLFAPVLETRPVEVPLHSVSPSFTPVCFASMFTGAPPAVHGIREYARPILRCDTLFDAARRAGLRVALVAVADCSIDRIFRERDLDYWSLKYDAWVTEKTLDLLRDDRHELIVAYHQEYDDVMHAAGPLARRAVRGAENHFAAYTELWERFEGAWAGHDRLLYTAPDHGAHLLPSGGGMHGTDSPEDMEVWHFAALRAGRAATSSP